MSASKPAVRADVAGWLPREHVAAVTPIAATIANRSTRPTHMRMERSFYDHAVRDAASRTPVVFVRLDAIADPSYHQNTITCFSGSSDAKT